MIFKYIFLSLFYFSFLGCSLFINKIDDDLLNKQTISYKKINPIKTYCQKPHQFELVNDNQKSQEIFESFIESNSLKKKFTYIDKVVLWSLIQMNLHPDTSSPTSKLQLFIRKDERNYFFHVYTKANTIGYPYLHTLNTLLKQFHSNYNLLELSNVLDINYPNEHFVSSDFADFLKKNQTTILDSPLLKKNYLRGDETLKKNERIKKELITPIVKRYLLTEKKTEYIINNYLFDFKRNNLITSQCNYDMGLYSSSIYLIHDKVVTSNTFGLRENSHVFMANSTQLIEKLEPLDNTIFLKGISQTRSPAMCQFSLPLNKDWNLWLISSDSRDPGQHLFHLMEYGLHEMTTNDQIDQMLRFSRHLFLKNPVRLILESERSNSQQLNELLKLNIPIYNAEKLGKIWGYFQANKSNTFIIDERRPGSLSCR